MFPTIGNAFGLGGKGRLRGLAILDLMKVSSRRITITANETRAHGGIQDMGNGTRNALILGSRGERVPWTKQWVVPHYRFKAFLSHLSISCLESGGSSDINAIPTFMRMAQTRRRFD